MQHTFQAVIMAHPGMDAAYVEVPLAVEMIFGSRRVKVRASFDGVDYRGSIVPMGGCYLLGVTKAIRRQLGKGPGDMVAVSVELDGAPREVEIPADIAALLSQNPEAKDYFGSLSYTRQKEYCQWLTSAKGPETRAIRLEKSLALLLAKKPLR